MFEKEFHTPLTKANWPALLQHYRNNDCDSTTMPAEQKAYCLLGYASIFEKVGLASRQASCCYLAMGPDLSTPLLTLNPDKIEGVDVCNWNADTLQRTLDSSVNLATATLPNPKAILARKRRRTEGFWNCKDLKSLGGWYLPLLAEMQSLGINPTKVRCGQLAENRIKLDFDWAHPTEGKNRRRTVILNGRVNLDGFVRQRSDPQQFDFYLDKGINIESFGCRFDRKNLSTLFRPQSVFVSSLEYNSRPRGAHNYPTCVERLMDQDLLRRTEIVNFGNSASSAIERDMRQRFPLFGWGYGWKMRAYIVGHEKDNHAGDSP
jgi:hypothetical protein